MEDRAMAEAEEVTEEVAQDMAVREVDLVEAVAEVMVAMMEVNKNKKLMLYAFYFITFSFQHVTRLDSEILNPRRSYINTSAFRIWRGWKLQ